MNNQQVLSDTKKSFDDYRKIIKCLKVKLTDLTSENNKLQQELGEIKEISSQLVKETTIKKEILPQADQNLALNQEILIDLYNNAKSLGFTLEMLYRGADVDGSKQIKVEDYKLLLGKIKLNLNSQQIQKLAQIFDDDYSGILQYNNYLLTLATYGVNSESLALDHQSDANQALIIFTNYLNQENIDCETAWNQIDSSKVGYATQDQFQAYIKVLNFKQKMDLNMNRRQISSLFILMDVDKKSKIEKSNFINFINKCLKNKDQSNQKEKSQIQQIIQQFQYQTQKPITHILVSILNKMQLNSKIMTFQNLVDVLQDFEVKFTFKEIFVIFQELDFGNTGNPSFDNFQEFFYIYKNQYSNFNFLLINLAHKLQSENQNTQQYLNSKNIYDDTEINQQEFEKLIKNLFKIHQDDSIVLFKQILNEYQLIFGQKVEQLNGLQFGNYIDNFRQIKNNNINQDFKDQLLKIQIQIQQIQPQKQDKVVFSDPYDCLRYCVDEALTLDDNNLWTDSKFSKSLQFDNDFAWKRLSEINQNYVFKNNQQCKINQGAFEDNWLLSALFLTNKNDDQIIYKNKIDNNNLQKLLQSIYPAMFHFLRQIGMYVFRFFKNFKPQYIVIDDYLPIKDGKSYFSQLSLIKILIENDDQDSNQFWVSLIEKAYAKFKGSYQQLNKGSINEELVNLNGKPIAEIQNDQDYKFLIQKELKQKSIIGCKTNNNDNGLLSQQMYLIMDYFELQKEKKSSNLFFIQNGFEEGDWKLKWSQQDQKFKENKQTLIQHIEQQQLESKGNFLMAYQNWKQNFQNILIQYELDDQWTHYQIQQSWPLDSQGSYPQNQDQYQNYAQQNEQFIMEVKNQSQFIINVYQQENILNINVTIFKLNESTLEKYDQSLIVQNSGLCQAKSLISIPKFQLEDGKYAIILSSNDQEQKGKYSLDIWFDAKTDDITINNKNNNISIQKFDQNINKQKEILEIFKIMQIYYKNRGKDIL